MDLGRNKNQGCDSLSSKKGAAEVYYRHCLTAQLVIRMHYGCNLPIASH